MFDVSQSPVWLAKMSLPALIYNPAPAECSLITSPLQMLLVSALLLPTVWAQNDLDFWNVERPPDMANIASLEVRYFFSSI